MADETQAIKKLISVKEAMDIMGIKRTSFYDEVKKGNITLKKFGSKSLCSLESVQDWIESLPTSGGENDQ